MKTMKDVLKNGVKTILDNQINSDKTAKACILYMIDEPTMPKELFMPEDAE